MDPMGVTSCFSCVNFARYKLQSRDIEGYRSAKNDS